MSPVKVLVISADPDVRSQLEIALRSTERATGEGWEVLEASNGIAGLKLAWREMPDLVVADEIASGAGAFAVAKDLRNQLQPFPGIIVIVLERRHDAWLARWSGADAWVVKPIDAFELADRVTAILGKRATAGGI
jgi:DNA-binding response OmpR family regulator